MNELKFCKNCLHYSRLTGECEHSESLMSICRISGAKTWSDARWVREESGKCRAEALLFEPKPTLKEKIKNVYYLLQA